MAIGVRRKGWSMAAVLVVLVVLAWAWIDGGREPVRTLSEPVPVPGAAQ